MSCCHIQIALYSIFVFGHFSWIEYIRISVFNTFSETKHIWYSEFGVILLFVTTLGLTWCQEPGSTPTEPVLSHSLLQTPAPSVDTGAESGRGEAPESHRASAGASLTLTEPEPPWL